MKMGETRLPDIPTYSGKENKLGNLPKKPRKSALYDSYRL